ncbi:terminase small subunit [Paraburkholderia aspalathi]|uniref:terminase small subunit n=1 Tax=Paraburkholderia aspalathi TaxID=1324617 RepID=UPI0038B6FC41
MSGMDDPKSNDSSEGKGARYPDEIWELIKLAWASAGGISDQKALDMVAATTNAKLPSKGAVSTYRKRNNWQRGYAPVQAKPIAPRDQSDRRLPKIEPAWEVDSLSPLEARFVEEYVIDRNATGSARRAGYSDTTAAKDAHKLLNRPDVRKAIQLSEKAMMERLHITQDMVLKYWWDIATCDPNEIVEYRRDNCRHCWGNAHAYQWIDNEEYMREVVRHMRDEEKATETGKKFNREAPDGAGGFGFVKSAAPNPDCPQCHGDGFGYVHIHDTRRLSVAARRLYAGMKEGKEGIEAKMHSQEKAWDNIARFIGMFKERVEIDLTVTSSKELDDIYATRMAQMRERAKQFVGRGERLMRLGIDPQKVADDVSDV